MIEANLDYYDTLVKNLKTINTAELDRAIKIIFDGFYKTRVFDKEYFNNAILTIYKNNKESLDMIFKDVESNKNKKFGKKKLKIIKKIINENGEN